MCCCCLMKTILLSLGKASNRYCRGASCFLPIVPWADSGGGTGDPEPLPPWDLSDVWSCVDIWWVGEGVQWLFLPYLIIVFFLARFARQYYTFSFINVWKIPITSMFKGSSLLPHRYIHDPWKVHFHVYFVQNTRFYTTETNNFSGGGPRPPTPPPWYRYNRFENANTIMSNVFLSVEITGWCHFYKSYCLESCFNG